MDCDDALSPWYLGFLMVATLVQVPCKAPMSFGRTRNIVSSSSGQRADLYSRSQKVPI